MPGFQFSGKLSITFTIRDRQYTLVSTTDMSQETPSVRFEYHANFKDAISLGKLQDAYTFLKTGLNISPDQSLNPSDSQIIQSLRDMPVLGDIFTKALDVEVCITDLVFIIDSEKLSAAVNGAFPAGEIALGLAFRCDPNNNTIDGFGVQLDSIGVLMDLKTAGTSTTPTP